MTVRADDQGVLIIAVLILVVVALLIAIYAVFLRSPSAADSVPPLQKSLSEKDEMRFHNAA